METIPFTTTVPENSSTATQVATTAPVASASRTTVPALLPAGASPPGTGTLSVVTSPAGALVFVNDVLLGSSPATIPGFSAGSYNLRLEKSGYRNKTVRVDIGEGKTTEYSTVLETESGGMGIVPIIAAVVVVAAGAGVVYWYRKRKKPVKSKVDWNNP
jgi:cobalamin biosynthesis Mg chelatase CobN